MNQLMTPVLIKDQKDQPELDWLDDERVFYLLTRDGLFICRNHEFFQSCAPAPTWPAELEEQRPFLRPQYPRLSQQQLQRIVGFFALIGTRHDAEAAVLLAWDRQEERVEIIVPQQVATVGRSWGGRTYPIGLHYSFPADLPPHQFIFGDVHSHVDLPAFSSGTDVDDELHQAGLHLVVGNIQREPPAFHAAAVVDGQRFRLGLSAVTEGYEKRDLAVPEEWIEQVRIQEESWSQPYSYLPASPRAGKRGNGRDLPAYEAQPIGRRIAAAPRNIAVSPNAAASPNIDDPREGADSPAGSTQESGGRR